MYVFVSLFKKHLNNTNFLFTIDRIIVEESFHIPVVDRKLLCSATAWGWSRIIPMGYPAAGTRRIKSQYSSHPLVNQRVLDCYSNRRCHPP